MLSLPTHEKFNHKFHFDKGSDSGIQLASANGWNTSTVYGPEYVTRMAAACPES
jgi:hypothetical protein